MKDWFMLYSSGMEVGRVLSYFNPCSTEHKRTCAHFVALSLLNKTCVVALTVFATLATLPLLGLGGLATFRYMTAHLFKAGALAQGLESVGVYLEAHCPQCPGMQKRKIKLEQAGGYNIIAHLWKSLDNHSITCNTCHKRAVNVIVNGLSHEVAYHRQGAPDGVREMVTLTSRQKRVYPLDGYYSYYQLTMC